MFEECSRENIIARRHLSSLGSLPSLSAKSKKLPDLKPFGGSKKLAPLKSTNLSGSLSDLSGNFESSDDFGLKSPGKDGSKKIEEEVIDTTIPEDANEAKKRLEQVNAQLADLDRRNSELAKQAAAETSNSQNQSAAYDESFDDYGDESFSVDEDIDELSVEELSVSGSDDDETNAYQA